MRDLADELLQAKVRSRLFGGDHAPRIGRLVILDRIGAGAMGTVYAAYDPRLDRKVAVKVMHAADRDANARFLREARALGKLAHPNIVTIFDAGDDTGSVHVVMELATGVPLRAWIGRTTGPRSWRDVVRAMTDVAAALAAAHRANIIHRDVKPDNILVGDDRTRLVDFGLALEPPSQPPASTNGDDERSAELAVTAVDLDDHAAGTPSYMAPEVLAGGAATPASDQFSFAVTLFEAIHGTRPYNGATRADLRDAAMRAADAVRRTRSSGGRSSVERPPPREPVDPGDPGNTVLSQAPADRPSKRELHDEVVDAVQTAERSPAWIDAILRRALASDPAKRFPSMDALAAELLRDRRRRRRTIAIVAAALVAGGLVGVLAYRGGATATTRPDEVSCDGHSRIDVVWNDRAAQRVRSGLKAAPWTAATLAGLGRFATDWEASFRTVCEATRIRGEQSDRLLEVRGRCLDRALDRLGALADALATPLEQGERIEAASAVGQLPLAKQCETMMDDEAPLPADPTARAEATAIERELDQAWAAYALGRYRNARTRALALSQRVGKLDDVAGLHGAVLLLGGALESRTGDGEKGRELLNHALRLAAKARAPNLELAIWLRLLRQAVFAGSADRAIDWAPFARAAAIRAGSEGGEIDAIAGDALRHTGKLEDARAKLTAALASRDLREDTRAMVEMNLASVDLALGKSAIAIPIYQRAYERSKRALGDGHPTLAIHLDRLAESARARGQLRAALELHDQSLQVRRPFGAKDRALATAYFHRAETLLEAGRLVEAEADAMAAWAIRDFNFGKASPRLAEVDALRGDIALASGKVAEAGRLYDHAHQLDPGPDPMRRVMALAIAIGVQTAPKTGPLDRARFSTLIDTIGIASVDATVLARGAAVLEPFSVDYIATTAGRLASIPGDKAAPLIPPLVARWRAAGPVDAALSLAIGDVLLLAEDRKTAAEAYRAALAALADEPSRARLRAFRGLALALDGDEAIAAAASANALAAAMPQLAR